MAENEDPKPKPPSSFWINGAVQSEAVTLTFADGARSLPEGFVHLLGGTDECLKNFKDVAPQFTYEKFVRKLNNMVSKQMIKQRVDGMIAYTQGRVTLPGRIKW